MRFHACFCHLVGMSRPKANLQIHSDTFLDDTFRSQPHGIYVSSNEVKLNWGFLTSLDVDHLTRKT